MCGAITDDSTGSDCAGAAGRNGVPLEFGAGVSNEKLRSAWLWRLDNAVGNMYPMS